MLAESIRTGKPSIPALRGMGIFDFLRQNDHLARLLQRSDDQHFGVGGACRGHRRPTSAPAARSWMSAADAVNCRGETSGTDRSRSALRPTRDHLGSIAAAELDVAERVRIEAGSFFDGGSGGLNA